MSAGLESQAGYTLLSDVPVLVEDLRTERRFNPLQGAIPRSLLRAQAVFFPFDTP